MTRLSEHFTQDEFACRCRREECDAPTLPNPLLIDRLETYRERLGRQPLTITSGIRCEFYNRFIGGRPNSAHMTGDAADILCQNSMDRFRMLRALFQPDQLYDRLGVGGKFIHVDVSNRLAPQVAWHYYLLKDVV